MNHEYELEAMMEQRDQFRAAVATSKSLNNFNCCTIIPTKLPIDAAGVSVTPGDATNSEFEGERVHGSALAQAEPTRESGLCSPSILLPSSVSSGAFNELARHSLNARNLAGEASSRKFRPAIFYSPIAFGSVSDNSEPKAVRFADVQNFFAGKQNA